MACRLMGRERPLLAAIELGRKVKRRILEKVGPMLRSSVGLATNRYLAKVAGDMEKPDGLVALPLDILPEALSQLNLRDLPGIGARTEKRLNEKGIRTMQQLMALEATPPASFGDQSGVSGSGTGCAVKISTWPGTTIGNPSATRTSWRRFPCRVVLRQCAGLFRRAAAG